MGRLICKNKKGKYKIWTTIADGWITDELKEEEMKTEIKRGIMEKAKKDCDFVDENFPKNYNIHKAEDYKEEDYNV